jgi:hypothetical protein
VAAAGIEVLAVADMLQHNLLPLLDKRTSAAARSSSNSSSSSSRVMDNSRSSKKGGASVTANSVPDALWDQLLPKLALALQENAVLPEAAVSGRCSDTHTSKSGSSTASSSSAPPAAAAAAAAAAASFPGAASMRVLSWRLLQLALAVVIGMAQLILPAEQFVAVAEPAARLAMAALAGATAQDTAAASGIVTACAQLGDVLMRLQQTNRSNGSGQGVGGSGWAHHMRQLLHSPHIAQLMLASLAGYRQGVLQAMSPAEGAGSGSSSSGSSNSSVGEGSNPSSSSSGSHTCPGQHAGTALLPAAQEAVSPVPSAPLPHEHLWQRLGLAPALLPLLSEAQRKTADMYGPADPYLGFSAAAAAAAFALEQAVASAAQLSSHEFGHSTSDATASDLSAAQLQLAVAAMPVPLLLCDTVAQLISRHADDGFMYFAMRPLTAAPKYLACLGLVASELNQAAGGRRSRLSMAVWDLPVQQLLQQAAQHMQELLASSAGQGSSDSTQQSNSNSSSSSSKGEASSSSGPPPRTALNAFNDWLECAAQLSRLAPHCKFVASEQQQAVCRQLAQDFPELLQQYLRLQLCVRDANNAPGPVGNIRHGLWATFRNSLSCLCLNDSSSSGLGAMVTEVISSGSMAAVGSREQQQLLQLLLSYVKSMLLLMQQPSCVSAYATEAQQQQQQHVGGTASIEVLVECDQGLASVMAVATRLLKEHELQPDGGVAATWQAERNGSCVPWLLLLARAMFASGQLLSALAAYVWQD